jgi:hypothetical protein
MVRLIPLLLVILLCGCLRQEPQEVQKPVCSPPYLLVGNNCCLDENSNRICDRDESTTTTRIPPSTSTTIATTTTSTSITLSSITSTTEVPTSTSSTSSTSSTLGRCEPPEGAAISFGQGPFSIHDYLILNGNIVNFRSATKSPSILSSSEMVLLFEDADCHSTRVSLKPYVGEPFIYYTRQSGATLDIVPDTMQLSSTKVYNGTYRGLRMVYSDGEIFLNTTLATQAICGAINYTTYHRNNTTNISTIDNFHCSSLTSVQTPLECFDSDGADSMSLFMRGAARRNAGEKYLIKSDECVSNDVVREYGCGEDGRIVYNDMPCQYGCHEGACKPAST